jgi:GTP-binding protein
MRGRANGSLVADRSGSAAAYAMFNLQERGSLFVTPGTEVYEGMIVGENSRSDDMDVNICRERKVTNVRQSTAEELERLVPPRLLSLEQALEFCADDECVEVTAGRRPAAQDRPRRQGARRRPLGIGRGPCRPPSSRRPG